MNDENRIFIGEDRNVDSKSVSFFCLEQKTGKVLWQDLSLEEKWWVGIESIHKEAVFFHGYAAPDMPDHKRIYAYNLHTGKFMWANSEVTFLFTHNDKVYVTKTVSGVIKFYECNEFTGEIVREVHEEDIDNNHSLFLSTQVDIRKFPNILDEDSLQFKEINNFKKHIFDNDKNKSILEYIEFANYFIVSYYKKIDGAVNIPDYQQEIMIFDRKSKRIIYRSIINSNTKALHPQMYFSIDNYLYYVKEKNTLTAIMLPTD